MKRPLEVIDSNQDPLRSKKARITVEILAARPRPSVLSPSKPAAALLSPSRQGMQTKTLHHYFPVRPILPQPAAPPIAPLPPPNRSLLPTPAIDTKTTTPTAKTPDTTLTAPTHASRKLQQPTPPPPPPTSQPPEHASKTTTTASHVQSSVPEHQKKLVNGIKHELDRLQPSAADTSTVRGSTGRKLRSQEATRFKSELSAYFPDYDEVIGNDPKEQHLLTTETPIIITDSRLSATRDALSRHITHGRSGEDYAIRGFGDGLFTDLVEAQRIDFSFLEQRENEDVSVDPLSDSYYQPSHRKAARLEKSIRNTERSRAQHEKDQIVRILGDLQGHDWLRIMGVNGVTETRKKSFEPAREHFIKGCQAILGKFRNWSQEEKRRKLEKERALAEEEAAETGDSEDEGTEVSEDGQDNASSDDDNRQPKAAGRRGKRTSQHIEMSDIEDQESDGDPPDSSDVDASIARQLRDEAELARAKYHKTHPGKRPRGDSFAQLSEQDSPSRHRDFTSFFRNKTQRDAALNRPRRRGRSAVAWGHDVPEPEKDDFDLPEEFREPETMKTRERQKRRARREAKH
ncbi:something about silencing, SAS, complex subunit 4-domain-containing protein [Microdochium bolleyi]|uniref:Something about silencing, SAS, complex subunit 4-domain-containing protein n=1 Tax=Microdochium bolleyi TaxID=196109 RepID=A0A136J312_9PEZI|nr:something about silencing, SAS, complex subunit 4-domain-containing protein [Microdochium bolleyi]